MKVENPKEEDVMERFNWQKGMGAALAALVSGLIAFLVLFGNPLSQRIIYSGEFGQSQKLLDMWRTVEPLPVLTPFMKDLFQVSPRKLAVVGLLFLWTLSAYKTMPREELFKIQHVEVDLSPDDMPGHAMYRVICDSCGEWVSDHREVKKDNKTLCKSCAYGGYYRVVS
ncbi:MAG: hypothetical protein ACE5GH_00665 [Fidelibacterota bacterium]